MHKIINLAYPSELKIVDHIVCTVHVQGGWTPLLCAAACGHENVAEVLLKAEASVDTPDKVHYLL